MWKNHQQTTKEVWLLRNQWELFVNVALDSAGVSDRDFLQLGDRHPVLLGADAADHLPHRLAHAVHHGNHCHRISQRRHQHLHRHGTSAILETPADFQVGFINFLGFSKLKFHNGFHMSNITPPPVQLEGCVLPVTRVRLGITMHHWFIWMTLNCVITNKCSKTKGHQGTHKRSLNSWFIRARPKIRHATTGNQTLEDMLVTLCSYWVRTSLSNFTLYIMLL